MHLYPNWAKIARKAWSMRLMALAVLLSGAELALPALQSIFPIGTFAALSAVVGMAAMIARIVYQQDLDD